MKEVPKYVNNLRRPSIAEFEEFWKLQEELDKDKRNRLLYIKARRGGGAWLVYQDKIAASNREVVKRIVDMISKGFRNFLKKILFLGK